MALKYLFPLLVLLLCHHQALCQKDEDRSDVDEAVEYASTFNLRKELSTIKAIVKGTRRLAWNQRDTLEALIGMLSEYMVTCCTGYGILLETCMI